MSQKKFVKLDIPVSHQTSELRIAVSGEQLDTVGSHDGEGSRVKVSSLSWSPSYVAEKVRLFRAINVHGPCGERWHRWGEGETQRPSHIPYQFSAKTVLNFQFAGIIAVDNSSKLKYQLSGNTLPADARRSAISEVSQSTCLIFP
jgi:hypothetical protein